MRHDYLMKLPLVSTAVLLLLASCGLSGTADLGDDSAPLQSGQEENYEPCGDKACGDACTLCDPRDADCVETDNLKFCDSSGACRGATPSCETGEACGSLTCAPGQVCCNDSCGICTAPGDSCTQQLCDDGSQVGADPCAGKACGDECSTCEPGRPCTTELKFCDARGVCGGSAACATGGDYQPCASKECGDPCTQCEPGDPDCVETTELKVCDAAGICRSGVSDCGNPECEDGETREAECGNTCDCVEGRWACTDIGCVTCGGSVGDTCGKEEYCAFAPGQECGAGGETAACRVRPEACTLEFAPVCGCDGNTYDNACAAAASGTGVLAEGECA